MVTVKYFYKEDNMETSKKDYPQFAGGTAAICEERITNTIDDFRLAPAVQNRLREIETVETTDSGIIVTFKVQAKQSSLCYTHATQLYLYEPCEPTVERLYMHIELWTDRIFRIVFSNEKEIRNPYEKLPKEMQMLIVEREKIDFTFENNTLSTNEIDIHINEKTGAIKANYKDGKEFYSQVRIEFKPDNVYETAVSNRNGEYACFEALTLDNDEIIYGLGERFDSVIRNGRTVDFVNKDAVGSTCNRTYINIPFYLSTKGYGLFLNSAAKTDWQIATKDTGAVQFAVQDNQMDYFVIAGRTPKKIIRGYCYLTGYSKLPPLWSFGLWMSRNSYTSWDIAEQIASEARENDVPCDVIHLDTAWFTEDWNCDLKFSPERFPNPKEHMEKLNKQGFKVSLWQYNFIPPRANNTHYAEALENGYLVTDKNGKPYIQPEGCKGSWTDDATVDFTNPAARKWYGDKIRGLFDLGASAIKTDFGEGVPDEGGIYHSVDGKLFHNLYTLVYNATVFNASKENIVWARSGTAGSQRFPLHWGGDSQCTFEALAGTLRGALSVGMSGIPFFSHDIGGFIGLPSDELYIRWAQMGLFSSHSRCHGVGDHTHREPWNFSKEALEIFRYYDKLRYSLMPYIYEQAEKCTKTGLPMMRALYLEYPEDRTVRTIDDEYLFGDSLLIAPVLQPTSKGNTRELYLPKGVWFDYFTKEKIISDGKWITRKIDLKTMPIYVKEGTVLNYCSADTTLANGMGEIIKTEKWI